MSKYDSVSKLLNEVWMNGFQEDTYGSCQEEGFAAALILSVDVFGMPSGIQGIIIENDQGFIDYEVFDYPREAMDRWKEMVNEWEKVFNPDPITIKAVYVSPKPN